MVEVIVIGSIYAVALLAFRGLGGIASAGEALRDWGRSAARSD
ncbi:MAG TPA: hypothetical protein VH306_03625 [Gaiellaceae bacterium]|jgi:hypothetical protein